MTSALERGEWSAARPGRTLHPGKYPVPIVQEAGGAPGLVWTGAENLAPTGFRFPDRSQSLYRLSYPAHKGSVVAITKETSCSKLSDPWLPWMLIDAHKETRRATGNWVRASCCRLLQGTKHEFTILKWNPIGNKQNSALQHPQGDEIQECAASWKNQCYSPLGEESI
jgi:hypothetical protein